MHERASACARARAPGRAPRPAARAAPYALHSRAAAHLRRAGRARRGGDDERRGAFGGTGRRLPGLQAPFNSARNARADEVPARRGRVLANRPGRRLPNNGGRARCLALPALAPPRLAGRPAPAAPHGSDAPRHPPSTWRRDPAVRHSARAGGARPRQFIRTRRKKKNVPLRGALRAGRPASAACCACSACCTPSWRRLCGWRGSPRSRNCGQMRW